MGPVSTERSPARVAWALLLAALVAALGLTVVAPASGVAASARPDAGMAIGGTPLDAIAPTRAAGGLIAEPSHVDGPVGALPSGLPVADLIRLGGWAAPGPAEPRGALRGVAGVRGPPSLAGFEI
jgi:hypothetical protein